VKFVIFENQRQISLNIWWNIKMKSLFNQFSIHCISASWFLLFVLMFPYWVSVFPAYYMTAPLAVTIYLLPVTSYELGYSGRWPCVGDLICEHAIHLHLPARCQYLHLGKSKSFSANSRMKSVRWSESGCIGCTGWAAGTFYNGNTWCHINVNIINFMF